MRQGTLYFYVSACLQTNLHRNFHTETRRIFKEFGQRLYANEVHKIDDYG